METLKVNERRDDTTKPDEASRPARGAGRYYYDDATGYETYEPEETEANEADEDETEEARDEESARPCGCE
jgi:hypothetical protein